MGQPGFISLVPPMAGFAYTLPHSRQRTLASTASRLDVEFTAASIPRKMPAAGKTHAGRRASRVRRTSPAIASTSSASDSKAASSLSRSQSSTTSRLPYRSPS